MNVILKNGFFVKLQVELEVSIIVKLDVAALINHVKEDKEEHRLAFLWCVFLWYELPDAVLHDDGVGKRTA